MVRILYFAWFINSIGQIRVWLAWLLAEITGRPDVEERQVVGELQ
jgi:hypothetical protein